MDYLMVIKQMIADGIVSLGVAAKYVPELKESEDERIKKEIIEMLRNWASVHYITKEQFSERMAWLEKQGDKDKLIQELGEYKVKYTQEVLENHINSMNNKDYERLRKTTIDFLKEFVDKGYENAVECIEWLEKQGESYTKMDVDDAYLKGVTNTKNEIEKQYEANYQIRKDIATFIFNYKGDIKDRAKWMNYLGIKVSFAKKQGEQEKPQVYETENGEIITYSESKGYEVVEPKFKVGDWIVQGCNILKIRCVSNEYYCYETVGGYIGDMLVSEIDSLYHLWTIEDAKDGDVLFQDLMDGKTFIYNGVNPDMAILYSFLIRNDGEDVLPYHIGKPNTGIGYVGEHKNIIYPATKEQRDLLFQKMHEEGYEWDAEKKELKKINQKPVEWSEDDEYWLDSTLCEVEMNSEHISNATYIINWLKLLKDRVHPQPK